MYEQEILIIFTDIVLKMKNGIFMMIKTILTIKYNTYI